MLKFWMVLVMAGVFGTGVVADEVSPLVDSDLATPQMCPEGEVVYYRLRGPQCAPRFQDAGQDCASALDCEGQCLVQPNGPAQCAEGPLSFGCTEFLDLNGDIISICIE